MKNVFKQIICIGLALSLVGGTSFGAINYRVASFGEEQTYTIEEAKKADVAIVLGALVYSSGRVSPILQDRIDTAIDLYDAGKVDKILMSGDHGRKNYDEVNAMREYAISKGVKEEDIFMDHAGFSTYETMYRAKEIFEVKSAIIVTQEFHMARSVYLASKLGIEAIGVTSDRHIYPRVEYYEIRESLARVKDFALVNLLKPEPTYLGEKINVMGDGRVTNDK